jgi:predicted RNase H-like HicB family nuclease
MKEIQAIIERAKDGTYSVYCKDEIFSGMGDTIEEAKADMLQQMDLYRATAKEEGFKYPEFLDDGFKISYTVDALSLMDYYLGKGWFSLATLEKVTGISQKQLWAYVHGTKPRKTQEERIRAGLQNISKDLDAIFA